MDSLRGQIKDRSLFIFYNSFLLIFYVRFLQKFFSAYFRYPFVFNALLNIRRSVVSRCKGTSGLLLRKLCRLCPEILNFAEHRGRFSVQSRRKRNSGTVLRAIKPPDKGFKKLPQRDTAGGFVCDENASQACFPARFFRIRIPPMARARPRTANAAHSRGLQKFFEFISRDGYGIYMDKTGEICYDNWC